MNRTARNVVIVLAIAALVALVQGGQTAANVALQALSLVFLGVIVYFLSIIYRQYRTTLYGLGDRRRAMLYVALGVGTLTLTASSKLWATGAGSVVWVLLLAASIYTVFTVVWSARKY
jgi:multisubunit Na+/H+ antiporter MnhB subunit